MFGSGEPFDYGTCPRCGTVFILQVPANLGDYYGADQYYSFDADPQAMLGRPPIKQVVGAAARSAVLGRDAVATALRLLPREQLQFMLTALDGVRLAGLPQGADTRVLDVGCGTGLLVYALSLAGLEQVTGSDPFAPADRTFDTGAQVLRRDLSGVDGPFGLVMSHHGFEHVPDPFATLQEMRRILGPDGRVLIRTPTVSSLAYERYGVSWAQLDPPRHLTILSRRGMELLCERAGFVIRAVQDDASAFQFWASEQVQAGDSLVGPRTPTTRSQRRRWAREARAANAAGRGDQAAWVLAPAERG